MTQADYRKLSTILLFFLGFIENHVVQGLDTYNICPGGAQTISNPDANVIISHQASDSAVPPCTLTLGGLRPNGYIAIKGASLGTNGRECRATILVGGDEYCVGGTVIEPVIQISADGNIDLKLDSNASSFDMELLTNCEYDDQMNIRI